MEIFSEKDFINNIFENLSGADKKLGHANIIIAGKTGVGKSTLINSVFNEKIAEVGIGRPVTNHIKEYNNSNMPITLYDTVGLELSSERLAAAQKEMLDLIMEKQKNDDPNKIINCIWYCVNATSNRFEQAEADFIEKISREANIPVIIVLTQSFNEKQSKKLAAEIEDLNLNATVIRVLAEEYELTDDIKIAPFGLDLLVEYVYEILPENSRKAFVAAQKVSIKLKRRTAHAIVAGTAATSFATGFLPIPFSDAIALIPTQVAMISGITAAYKIELEKGVMASIFSCLVGITGVTIGGRALSAELLKLIPGVGGTINGATAAILTIVLGETYIFIIEAIAKGEILQEKIGSEEFKAEIKKVFENNLKAIGKSPLDWIKKNK